MFTRLFFITYSRFISLFFRIEEVDYRISYVDPNFLSLAPGAELTCYWGLELKLFDILSGLIVTSWGEGCRNNALIEI